MNPPSPTFAALVLGSDSFRLQIGRWRDGRLHTLDSWHAPLRLAAALDARGCLSDDALQSALACVQSMRARLDAWPLAAVRVVATSTLRMARNSQVLLPAAERLLGHPIEVLSGEREGALTWMGATGGADECALVLGIGGGSAQLALGSGARVQRAASLALGTARIGLTFFAEGRIDASAFAAAVGSCRARIADVAPAYGPQRRSRAFGASGTVRTLARLMEDNGAPGAPTPAALDALRACVLAHAHGGEHVRGLGVLRLRDVAAALAILHALMAELEIDTLELPADGLRAGLLAELLAEPGAQGAVQAILSATH